MGNKLCEKTTAMPNERKEGANFTGIALQRGTYAPVEVKQFLTKIEAMQHERYGLGIPWAEEPHPDLGIAVTDEDRLAMQMLLEELRVNAHGHALTPHGWALKIFGVESGNGGNAAGTNVRATIEACNRDIFGAYGASFETMGDAKFGSFALGSIHNNHYENAVEGDGGIITEALTLGNDGWSPLQRLRDLNYPGARIGDLYIRNIPTKDAANDVKVMIDGIRYKAIRATKQTEDYMLERLNSMTNPEEWQDPVEETSFDRDRAEKQNEEKDAA